MRKFAFLLVILAMVLPLAVPFAPALAQESTAVLDALQAYNANLPAAYGNVSASDLAIELVENPDIVLVDVRQPEEYEGGHIEGAFNVPIRTLAQNLDKLPDIDAKIVVICGSAFRSSLGMTSLQILGYTDVRNMSGGMRAWLAEEYATTTEPAEAPEVGDVPDAIDPDVLAAVDAQLSSLPDGWGAVSVDDLNVEMIENPPDMLIDVRTPAEWENGYIAGAVHMPLSELMSYVDELPEDKAANIVIYCQSGHRGNMAATMLRTLGYTNVRNLSGGVGGWTTAGLPLEGVPEGEPAAEEEAFSPETALSEYIASMPGSFNAVRVADVAAAIADNPDLVLVDVRTPAEFAEGHIAGALSMPISELTDHLDMLPDLDADIIVYCGSGHRSALGMVALNLLGYHNAQSMLSGVRAITDEIELVTDPTKAEAGTAPAIDDDLFAAIDAYVKSIPAGYYTISADDLNLALIENPPAIVDVRTPAEVESGVIEGAVAIPLSELMSAMDQWPQDKSQPVVVYASHGHRSAIAMVAMQLMGYEDVRSLAGGTLSWEASGYPFVTE